jgi:hypothetical protein
MQPQAIDPAADDHRAADLLAADEDVGITDVVAQAAVAEIAAIAAAVGAAVDARGRTMKMFSARRIAPGTGKNTGNFACFGSNSRISSQISDFARNNSGLTAE